MGSGQKEHRLPRHSLEAAGAVIGNTSAGRAISTLQADHHLQGASDVSLRLDVCGNHRRRDVLFGKSGFHDATPHGVVVTAKGFLPGKLSDIEVRRRLNLTVRLHASDGE